jgi:hypothetical protein
VRLHLAAGPNRYITLDLHEGTYEAVVPDGAAVEVGWLYNLHPLAEANVDDTHVQ